MADVALCVYIYNTFEAYALKSLRTIFCLVNRQTISARLQLGLDPGLRNRKDLLIGARRFSISPPPPPYFHLVFFFHLWLLSQRLKGTKKGSDTLNA